MTKRVIGSGFFGIWLGCFTAVSVQLPPEILVDRYLFRAERLMDAKDPKGALVMMNKIVTLQKEHSLTLPDGFHFRYAKVAMASGSVQDAIDAVNTYLLVAGREGEFYREALELLDEAETEKARVEAETELSATQAGQAPPDPKTAGALGRASTRRQEVSSTGTGGEGQGADYSKCAEFFNNPGGNSYHIIRQGPFFSDRFRFVPFELQQDGSIEVQEDLVVSRETRKVQGGTETTIQYKSPPLAVLESLDPDQMKSAPKEKTVKVVIRRDEGRNISEIYEEVPRKFASSTLYEFLLGNRTEFKMKSGQCVPMRSSSRAIKKDGSKVWFTTRITPLCRDLVELFEDTHLTHELTKEINDKAYGIFQSHFKGIEPPDGDSLGVSTELISEFIKTNYHAKASKTSLTLQLLMGQTAHLRLPLLEATRRMISPMVFSQSIVVDCDRDRLGPFIRDDSLWEGRDEVSGLDAAVATETGTTVGESTQGGEAVGNTGIGTTSGERSGTSDATAGGGPCQVPGYPNPPGGVAKLGFSWCPSSVGMQVRAFALQAAGAECAIATGSSSTPEQIEARRREIEAACGRLAALGQGNCQCPPGLGQ